MTAFPALEEALDAAAHRHYGSRSRRRRRFPWARLAAVPALALAFACVAAVVFVVPERSAREGAADPLVVPAETLDRSRALTLAPGIPPSGRGPQTPPIAHADLPAVAAEIAAGVPYPPGAAESMDWRGLPEDPSDMGAISFRSDMQFLIEYRAYCAWMLFWLHAHGTGEAPAAAAAATVLAEIPRWPTLRNGGEDSTSYWSAVAAGAAAGDATPVRHYASINCQPVQTPWNATIR